MSEVELLERIKQLEARLNAFENRENHRFSVLEADGDIKTEGGIVAGSLTYDPPANNIVLLNPNNESASVGLRFNSDIANLRYGGSGAGSANGFEIQGASDAVKLKLLDGGDLRIPGGFTAGDLTTDAPAGCIYAINSTGDIPLFGRVNSDTDSIVMLRLDKRHAAGANNKRWDFEINDATGDMTLSPVDANASFIFTTLGAVSVMTVDIASGDVTIATNDGTTTSHSRSLILQHNTSGTPAGGFGNQIHFQLESTTTLNQDAATIAAQWEVATHASRRGSIRFFAYDASSSREVCRMSTDGSAATIGFYGVTPVARQNVTGAKAGNVALANLVNALAVLGLITDGTS